MAATSNSPFEHIRHVYVERVGKENIIGASSDLQSKRFRVRSFEVKSKKGKRKGVWERRKRN